MATARAVAALPALCEYCLPFVKVGGRFIALKGRDGAQEAAAAAHAMQLLGGTAGAPLAVTLPAAAGEEPMERLLLPIDKTAHTPTAYPRQGTKITKKPL